jgi:hypothetical protein
MTSQQIKNSLDDLSKTGRTSIPIARKPLAGAIDCIQSTAKQLHAKDPQNEDVSVLLRAAGILATEALRELNEVVDAIDSDVANSGGKLPLVR